ncbi:MAG: hypothetical protein ACYS9X_30015 [Planctomycetota bacterium]
MKLGDLEQIAERPGYSPRPSGQQGDSVPNQPAVVKEPTWYVINSTVFADRFVYCTEKKALKSVREQLPHLAVYFPPEADELLALEETMPREEWCRLVRRVHALKKRVKGWIVPSGSKLYEEITRAPGLDDPPGDGEESRHGQGAEREARAGVQDAPRSEDVH